MAIVAVTGLLGLTSAAEAAEGGQPSTAQLHATARSLIQPGMHVTRIKDAGCGEGYRFPSCVDVYFQIPGPLARRESVALRPAQAHGWKLVRRVRSNLLEVVKLERGPYTVNFGFWRDRWYKPSRPCALGDPTLNRVPPCADSFELLGYHDSHPKGAATKPAREGRVDTATA